MVPERSSRAQYEKYVLQAMSIVAGVSSCQHGLESSCDSNNLEAAVACAVRLACDNARVQCSLLRTIATTEHGRALRWSGSPRARGLAAKVRGWQADSKTTRHAASATTHRRRRLHGPCFGFGAPGSRCRRYLLAAGRLPPQIDDLLDRARVLAVACRVHMCTILAAAGA
eukprot:NODE_16013_length_1017_cov_3.580899.p1 GENE.NODE_16013_length_1017_cov_3.580899~~NODE_16013_length_1017_cov_3.580899.p1  ORF type:complete len:170 (-),score=11.38 NODE_16013_length_1017_cov_3.580899:105-614(-)